MKKIPLKKINQAIMKETKILFFEWKNGEKQRGIIILGKY